MRCSSSSARFRTTCLVQSIASLAQRKHCSEPGPCRCAKGLQSSQGVTTSIQDFAQVRSLFAGEAPKHVDSFQCQLMLIEQVKKQADHEGQQDDFVHPSRGAGVESKTPSPWRTCLNAEAPSQMRASASDSQGAFGREMPGTGKTTLSRRLAYRWAQGKRGVRNFRPSMCCQSGPYNKDQI